MIFYKKLLMISFICLLLFSFAGCNDKTNTMNKKAQIEGPPLLKVSYREKSIYAKTGTYSWTYDNNNGTKTAVNTDSSGPSVLVKNSKRLTVPPGSSINLSFTDKPKKITVNLFQNDKSIHQQIIDYKLVVPQSKGQVIYAVIATWNKGTVTYAFLVNID